MPNSTLLTVETLSTRVMWNSVLQTNHTQLWRKGECKWSSLVQGGSTNEQPKSTPTGRLEKILGIQGSGVRWTVACAPLVLIKSQSQHKQRPQGRWWPWSDPEWALDHLCPCFNPFLVLREPLSVRIGILTPLSVGIWRWCHLLTQPRDWVPLVVCSRCLGDASTSHRQRSPSSCITHAPQRRMFVNNSSDKHLIYSSSRPITLESKSSVSSNDSPLLWLHVDTWVAGDSYAKLHLVGCSWPGFIPKPDRTYAAYDISWRCC